MRRLFSFAFAFFLAGTQAQAELFCSQNLLDEASLDLLSKDVWQTECEEIRKKNSCSEVKTIDFNKKQKLMTSMSALDQAFKEKNGKLTLRKKSNDIFTDIKEQVHPDALYASHVGLRVVQPSRGDLLKANYDTYKHFSRDSNVELRSLYHMYLGRSNNAAEFSKRQEEFVDDYLQFASEFECTNGVDIDVQGTFLTLPNKMTKDAGLGECVSQQQKSQLEAMIKRGDGDEFFDQWRGQQGLDRGVSCNPQIVFNARTVVAQHTPSCAGRFEQHFADNKWDINTASLEQDEDYIKFQKCIADMEAKGHKLTNVSIQASASQLNNTVPFQTQNPDDNICPKDFKKLSQKRANSAKDLLVSKFSFPSDKVSINANGRNGNGSSGECPYELKNGKEVLKSGYQPGGAKRKELDEAKYVRVTANFEPKIKPVANGKTCYEAEMHCSKIVYKCGEWKQYDQSWYSRQAYKRRNSNTR